jgi:hypothetical protein
MIEFEKWYKNEPRSLHLKSQNELCKIGWKAAFEEIKSKIESNKWRSDSFVIAEIYKFICEELDETKKS